LHVRSSLAGQTSYYHYDGLGSTRCLTDSNGNVTDSYAYTAFGEAVDTGAANPTTNPFQFVGREGYYVNPDSGDYYVRARTYAPVIARWLSEDMLADGRTRHPSGWNLYTYADLQPTVEVDPSGEVVAVAVPSDHCGPDVTAVVNATLAAVKANFNDTEFTKRRLKMRDACVQLYDPRTAGTAWDIWWLYAIGKGNPNIPLYAQDGSRVKLGTGHCKTTVIYNGQCVLASGLNYLLWGKANKLCSEAATVGNWAPYRLPPRVRINISGRSIWVPLPPIPISWSQANAEWGAAFWKLVRYGKIPGSEEYDEAMDFLRAGYKCSDSGTTTHPVKGCSIDSPDVVTEPKALSFKLPFVNWAPNPVTP
jgi:RHS repeat-associated protein